MFCEFFIPTESEQEVKECINRINGRFAEQVLNKMKPKKSRKLGSTAEKFLDVVSKHFAQDEEGIVLKAYNGDRAKNLEALADAFQGFLKLERSAPENSPLRRTLEGYCEQLRIIADELRENKSK